MYLQILILTLVSIQQDGTFELGLNCLAIQPIPTFADNDLLQDVVKMISEPMVCSTQTMQLSCVRISTISKWGELSLEPHHLGVPSGASKAISKPMVRFGAKCAPILH